MDVESLRGMLVVAATVFVAELADKTQLATLTFASTSNLSKFQVWLAASVGLIIATGLAVLAAHLLAPILRNLDMARIGGLIFVALGAWMIARG